VKAQWLAVYAATSASGWERAIQSASEEIGDQKVADLICFANDWTGDPLSKKHIMTRFARRHRILWINSINNRRPRLAQKDAKRMWQKLREFRSGLRQVEENIWVLTPLFIPFHSHRLIRALNRRLLGYQIRRAARRLGFREIVSWVFIPASSDVVGKLGEKRIVYHCVDEYGAFSDAASEIEAREQELLAKADLVIFVQIAGVKTDAQCEHSACPPRRGFRALQPRGGKHNRHSRGASPIAAPYFGISWLNSGLG